MREIRFIVGLIVSRKSLWGVGFSPQSGFNRSHLTRYRDAGASDKADASHALAELLAAQDGHRIFTASTMEDLNRVMRQARVFANFRSVG